MLLCSLQHVRKELVDKLSRAALMTSALESQIKRFNYHYTQSNILHLFYIFIFIIIIIIIIIIKSSTQ